VGKHARVNLATTLKTRNERLTKMDLKTADTNIQRIAQVDSETGASSLDHDSRCLRGGLAEDEISNVPKGRLPS
jgi:hypothetical protein